MLRVGHTLALALLIGCTTTNAAVSHHRTVEEYRLASLKNGLGSRHVKEELAKRYQKISPNDLVLRKEDFEEKDEEQGFATPNHPFMRTETDEPPKSPHAFIQQFQEGLRRRARQVEDDQEKCAPASSLQDIIAKQMRSKGTSKHAFYEKTGDLYIKWAGKPANDMMVLVTEPDLDIFANNDDVHTLYTSQDYGQTFQEAKNIVGPVWDCAFSPTPMDDNNYVAYATREDGSNKNLYVSLNGGQEFSLVDTPEHFDHVIVSPLIPTEFIGLDTIPATGEHEFFTCNLDTSSMKATCKRQALITDLQVDFLMTSGAEKIAYVVTADDGSKGLYTLEDGEKTMIMDDSERFLEIEQYIFAFKAKDNADTDTESQMFVSNNGGASFKEIVLPKSEKSKNNHFDVVDASEDVVFLAVQHVFTEQRGEGRASFSSNGAEMLDVNCTRAAFSDIIEATTKEAANELVLYHDSKNPLGCPENGSITLPTDGRNYAVIVKRGQCFFASKLQNAFDAGAYAVIIVNYDDHDNIYMVAPDGVLPPPIPEVIIAKSDGDVVFEAMAKAEVTTRLYEEAVKTTPMYQHSNLYVSDKDGIDYTVSLKDIIISGNEEKFVDVYRINAMSGSFLANKYDYTKKGSVTVLTYDKGALWWSPVVADDEGENLHISLDTAFSRVQLPTPQSLDTAPGVVLANGWFLDKIPGNARDMAVKAITVLSYDGGYSWKRMDNEAHMFRILDHGGVLLYVPWRHKANSIKFSVFEGRGSPSTYQFIDDDASYDLDGEWIMGSGRASCTWVNTSSVDEEYRCIAGNARWSPGFMTVYEDINGKRKLSMTAMRAGANREKFEGTFDTDKKRIQWDGDTGGRFGIKGTQWRFDATGSTNENTVYVQGVVAEPTGNSLVAVMYWYDQVAHDWIGLRLDFGKLFFKQCDDTSDFEDWMPTLPNGGGNCVMGAKRTFKRRKQCSFCANMIAQKGEVNTQSCACTNADFKCQTGFYRAENIDNPIAECEADVDHIRDLCTQLNNPSSVHKYELIPDNECKKGTGQYTKFINDVSDVCKDVPPGSTKVTSTVSVSGAQVTTTTPEGKPNTKSTGKKGGPPTMIIVIAVCVIIGVIIVATIFIRMRKRTGGLSIAAYTTVEDDDDGLKDDEDLVGGL